MPKITTTTGIDFEIGTHSTQQSTLHEKVVYESKDARLFHFRIENPNNNLMQLEVIQVQPNGQILPHAKSEMHQIDFKKCSGSVQQIFETTFPGKLTRAVDLRIIKAQNDILKRLPKWEQKTIKLFLEQKLKDFSINESLRLLQTLNGDISSPKLSAKAKLETILDWKGFSVVNLARRDDRRTEQEKLMQNKLDLHGNNPEFARHRDVICRYFDRKTIKRLICSGIDVRGSFRSPLYKRTVQYSSNPLKSIKELHDLLAKTPDNDRYDALIAYQPQ